MKREDYKRAQRCFHEIEKIEKAVRMIKETRKDGLYLAYYNSHCMSGLNPIINLDDMMLDALVTGLNCRMTSLKAEVGEI